MQFSMVKQQKKKKEERRVIVDRRGLHFKVLHYEAKIRFEP